MELIKHEDQGQKAEISQTIQCKRESTKDFDSNGIK